MRWAVLFLAASVGCVNLKTVRDFAGESARFSAYTELTAHFRDTCRRERPYLSGEAAELAQANDRQRQAACRDLLELQRALSAYMRTLARLAGEETFDVSEGLGEAASGIGAHADYGLDARHAAAYAGLSRVVARWATSARQQRAVRDLIQEADPSLQALLDGMASVVDCCRRTNENEKDTVTGMLEVEIAFADRAPDRLLAALAKAHLQSRLDEYRLADAMCGSAERGIRKIQEGHRTLFENCDRLSRAEAAAAIDRCSQDLRTIRSKFRILGWKAE